MDQDDERMEAKPSGDIDRDFRRHDGAHHQGAIDMAVLELRYGKTNSSGGSRRKSSSARCRKSRR